MSTPDAQRRAAAETIPVYLDCDTGIDDALALAYLASQPHVDLVGIGSVSGNVDARTAARNTLDLLELLGLSHVPVAIGCHDPLVGAYAGGSPHVHGDAGIGPVILPTADREPTDESAAHTLVRLAREYSGDLRVIALGPLTNLATALELNPELASHVHSVTVMGAAAAVPGNITPVAEANIFHDPEAAQLVLDASWPLTLVPLDVTMDHVLTDEHQRDLERIPHPVAPYLAHMLAPYFSHYQSIYGRAACAMHDPLAAAVAVGTARVTCAPRIPVTIDTGSGPGRGQTICDLRGRFIGYPAAHDARCQVVLTISEPFAPVLMSSLKRLASPEASPNQPQSRLTVVGSTNRDLIATGAQLPKAGETVSGATLSWVPGGKGANQAAAAARLAGASRLVSAIGQDADGTALRDQLASYGVDVADVRVVQEPTGTALIAVDPAGENQIVVCPGANTQVSLDGVEFSEDEAVLCQLEIDIAIVEEAARRHRGFFALNAAPARSLSRELVDRCDLIIVNEGEFAALPEVHDARQVAVTYGSKGSALFRSGELVAEAPGLAAKVVSTVGAGDAFCAALVLALHQGMEPKAALTAANAVGAHAVADAASQPEFERLESYHPATA